MPTETKATSKMTFEDFKNEILNDYKIAVTSRECSLLGRREVLTGKAKFGIFGDGKEVPQLAWAKVFKNGDFRSGYYRDQTFMMAIGELTIEQFFAGLYAHTSIEADPMSAGRQMGGHFGTHSLDENGEWKNLTQQKNSSADISPTAGQMPRLLGLAQASKIYRNVKGIDTSKFSVEGNEVAWGTIGNASTSEGLFFETINAAGVLQVPMVISIWDDEYGISVHAKHQTTKENISEILKGFQRDEDNNGYEILRVNGWDYSSHERYKSKDRLDWEVEYDCIAQMRLWMIANNFATEDELNSINKEIKKKVRDGKKAAWNAFLKPILEEQIKALELMSAAAQVSPNKAFISKIISDLQDVKEPGRKEVASAARKTLRYLVGENSNEKIALQNWINTYMSEVQPKYSSHLHSESNLSVLNTSEIKPTYNNDSETAN